MRIMSDFYWEDKENMEYYMIIGVVKNFYYEILWSDINVFMFVFGGIFNCLVVKF